MDKIIKINQVNKKHNKFTNKLTNLDNFNYVKIMNFLKNNLDNFITMKSTLKLIHMLFKAFFRYMGKKIEYCKMYKNHYQTQSTIMYALI